MDMSLFASQVTLKNYPPPDYSTYQIQLSSIQIPPKNPPQHHAYAPKSQLLTSHPHHPTMQTPQYETPLHQVPWHHAPLMQFPIPTYQMSLYQRPPMPYFLELRQT